MKDFIVTKGTFVRSLEDTKKISFHYFFVLLFLCVFAVIKNGIIPYFAGQVAFNGLLFPILFILTSVITSLLVDLVFQFLMKVNTRPNYLESINMGILLALVLPMYTPLLIVALGAFCAVCSKYLMNKFFKRQILTPVLIGWGIIMAAYLFHLIPPIDYLNPIEVDLGTPLSRVPVLSNLGSYDYLVKPYGSLLDFLIGLVPGGMGTTSILLCITGFIYLTYHKVMKWRIPVVTIATVFVTTMMIGGFSGLDIWYPTFQICSGALIFGSIFLAANHSTSPVTPIGQILYGLFLGCFIVILRFFTPLVDGALVAMLFMPLLRGIFDYFGAIARFNFNRSIIPFVVAWLMILFIGCFLGIHYQRQMNLSNVTYNISVKGIS